MDQANKKVLIRNLNDASWAVRQAAWFAAAPLFAAGELRAELVVLLNDDDSDVRQAACSAAAPLFAAGELRAELVGLLKDSNWDVRQAAWSAAAPRFAAGDDSEIEAIVKEVTAPIKADYFAVLDRSPSEVPFLINELYAGRVEGTQYNGTCGCLLATLARGRGLRYDQIPGLEPDSDRPSERWFLGIREGDRPDTNGFALLAVKWAREYQETHSLLTSEPT